MLDEALEILREINARGRLAVVVGGAVRDLQLGRPLTDVDLATDMPLDELSSLYTTHAVGRSEQFETVVIVRGGRAFEISRFRRGAGAAPAHGADQMLEDTAHRDFTINALMLGADGAVIDLQGGLADLRNRVVRCVGSPRERFAEDPARILRAVRFAACLGFTIEGGTAEAIAREAPRLASVAGERIGKEILKLGSEPGAALAEAVALMDRFGMLGVVLPEIAAIRDLPRAHLLAALRSSTAADPGVNLAVLLHAAGGQPAAAGPCRCRGRESAGTVDAIARRLHLPQRLRAAIAFAVEHQQQAGQPAGLRRSALLALLASDHWPVLRALALSDVAGRGDGGGAARLEAAFREAESDAAAEREARAGAPLVTGSRIMELTGLAPGPRVGEIQRGVTSWALDNRVEARELIEARIVRLGGEGRATGKRPARDT